MTGRERLGSRPRAWSLCQAWRTLPGADARGHCGSATAISALSLARVSWSTDTFEVATNPHIDRQRALAAEDGHAALWSSFVRSGSLESAQVTRPSKPGIWRSRMTCGVTIGPG